MATVIRVPEISASAATATVSCWLASSGESIQVSQPLVELETDKASVEVQATEAGILGPLMATEGSELGVGEPLCVILSHQGEQIDLDRLLARTAGGNAPLVVPDSAIEAAKTDRQIEPLVLAPPGREGPSRTQAPEPTEMTPRSQRLFVSPIVRQLARTHNLDVSGVAGSGPRGRIQRRDIEELIRSRTPVDEPPSGLSSKAADFEEVSHTRMRRAIAARLTESKSTVPHFYLHVDVPVDRLIELQTDLREGLGTRLSLNDFIVRAVALALIDVPDANVIWTADSLWQYKKANIAVAVATDRGLVTPVVRSAEAKTVAMLNAEIHALASRAREGRISPTELEGGSITVSNLGKAAVDSFAAIINPPHSMILAVGRARSGVIVEGSSLVAGRLMGVTLSVDHRAIDGLLAARWFESFQDFIRRPSRMLV